MGRDVPAITISRRDRRAYRAKVRTCLDVFARMLHDSRFETGYQQVGLEIEFNLVDKSGYPVMANADALAAIDDGAWGTELGKFNIELAAHPQTLTGGVLTALESAIRQMIRQASERVEPSGTRLVMVGILPSLREEDVGEDALSANARFKLLNDQMLAARGEEMRICIDGQDRVLTYLDTIMAEAACTSLQCHLQVSPENFARYWNASQAIAGIQVAIAANSPYLFGQELWRETRIPLFEQAIDTRPDELREQGVRPRVWFGDRWITSVFDLFEENLRYFPALLPLSEDEDPVEVLERGEAPELAELTLHNGTVYRWNRPVYAVVDGKPHLRVENRVMPAGPTVIDSIAGAAFYYGLVGELAEAERPVWSQMSFSAAASNLVAGARFGLEAEVYWPGVGMVPVAELTLRRLLPMAAQGLARWGVDQADVARLMSIVEQRCVTGMNGAEWQVRSVRRMQAHGIDRDEALRQMTQDYIELMNLGEPVHTWPAI